MRNSKTLRTRFEELGFRADLPHHAPESAATDNIAHDALDEIERLRAEIDAARAVLPESLCVDDTLADRIREAQAREGRVR